MQLSLQEHYNELLQILRDNHTCWDQEVLNSYPESITRPPEDWLEVLSTLTLDQLWLLDSKQDFSFIGHHKMRDCFEKLEQLTTLPRKKASIDHHYNQADAFFGVRGKKRYEIATLAPILKEFKHDFRFKRLIDIGGGQGHLGRVISKHFGVETLSVDRDPHLLNLGIKNVNRLQHRVLPAGAASINFKELYIKDGDTLPDCFDSDSFILGLHTCGDLSCSLMDFATQASSKGLLSFGCCYHKMNLNSDGRAKNGPIDLPLNTHALTLATRGHRSDSREAFDLKLQVKRHRYALHLFHYHERGIQRFYPMGETKAKEYTGPFSDYAQPRLEAYQIAATTDELENFYQQDWVIALYQKMTYANLIRWQFGRAVELFILLDRALKLERQGFKVEMGTYFNELKSPRNIGILAYRE